MLKSGNFQIDRSDRSDKGQQQEKTKQGMGTRKGEEGSTINLNECFKVRYKKLVNLEAIYLLIFWLKFYISLYLQRKNV